MAADNGNILVAAPVPDPVQWHEGMLLQPHHFQQEARYTERLLDSRVRTLSPYAWGFAELQLDDSLLALGRVGIARASGIAKAQWAADEAEFDALLGEALATDGPHLIGARIDQAPGRDQTPREPVRFAMSFSAAMARPV